MSEQEFEAYLDLLARMLKLTPTQRDAIAHELRDHMEDRLEELQARGVPRDEAVRLALDEFGDANVLASEFTSIAKQRNRRRMMQTTFGTLAACAAIALSISFLLPNNQQGSPLQPVADAQAGGREGSGGGGGSFERPGILDEGFGGGGAALFAEAIPVYDIHVVDCTDLLPPRNEDGMDLLRRTAALARAVEQTVGSALPAGSGFIKVEAFEEFLIITANAEAYDRAQNLLNQIEEHVTERENLRRAQREAQAERDAFRVREQQAQAERQLRNAQAQALQDEIDMLTRQLQLMFERYSPSHQDVVEMETRLELLHEELNRLLVPGDAGAERFERGG